MSKPFEWRILRVGSLRECLDAWQGSPLYAELDDSMRTASEITIDELGSNFLRYSGAKAKEMLLKITFDGQEIIMSFDDDGAEFDPTIIPEPPSGNIALLPVGGRGINMARRSTDSWEYHRHDDKRNVNVLRRRVERDPLAPPTEIPVLDSTSGTEIPLEVQDVESPGAPVQPPALPTSESTRPPGTPPPLPPMEPRDK